MLWIKFILLAIGLFFGISIVARIYYGQGVKWWAMLIAALAFAGFITLQWL